MIRLAATFMMVMCVGGCAAVHQPAPPPDRLMLEGTLDLDRPGIGIRVADEQQTLVCETRFAGGKLPKQVTLPLTCLDGRSGTISLDKAPELRGNIELVSGEVGSVVFAQAPPPLLPPSPAPPVAVAIAPPAIASPAPPPVYVPTRAYRSRSYSTGYVRAHTRRATYVRGHFRNGRYVSGHARRGSYVRSHYRGRR